MKYVENYWVEELPNGVIKLVVDCTQREIYFHQYSDYDFIIAGTEDEYDGLVDIDDLGKCNLSVSFFLPPIEGMYLWASMKEKEQLSFFYIPYLREWRKNRKFLLTRQL